MRYKIGDYVKYRSSSTDPLVYFIVTGRKSSLGYYVIWANKAYGWQDGEPFIYKDSLVDMEGRVIKSGCKFAKILI